MNIERLEKNFENIQNAIQNDQTPIEDIDNKKVKLKDILLRKENNLNLIKESNKSQVFSLIKNLIKVSSLAAVYSYAFLRISKL